MARKPLDRANPSRRSVLVGALAASGALARPVLAQTATLQVVTSFPEELTTRYEQEFEKARAGAHVQFVWKQSRDALEQLSRADQGGADVYWAPSLSNFPILRDRGALRALEVDRAVLPGKLGAQQLSDPSGFFEAYDIAGYGVAINPALLAERGLEAPRAWRDLAAPAYAGQIVMPLANKVGFSPALYDIILQSEGWEEGWALLSEIGGGSEPLAQGAARASHWNTLLMGRWSRRRRPRRATRRRCSGSACWKRSRNRKSSRWRRKTAAEPIMFSTSNPAR